MIRPPSRIANIIAATRSVDGAAAADVRPSPAIVIPQFRARVECVPRARTHISSLAGCQNKRSNYPRGGFRATNWQLACAAVGAPDDDWTPAESPESALFDCRGAGARLRRRHATNDLLANRSISSGAGRQSPVLLAFKFARRSLTTSTTTRKK